MVLKNSIFVSSNGTVIQLIDVEEAEEFHNNLREKLNEDYFSRVLESYFEAIDSKDLIRIFECLAIFDEIDNYPWMASPEILRRLLQVRDKTESFVYDLREEGPKDYVLFKNKLYSIK